MVKVEIPFLPEFEYQLKNFLKCMTTRSKKYGEVGDTFEAFGTTFQIVAVFRARLWRVAHYFYEAEGFYTPKEFIKCWNKIHYRIGYDKQAQTHFWIHTFFPTHEVEN
jgi:hypothetical protein